MFYEYALTYHMLFGTFSLYPPAADRKAWEALDETWKKDAVALGRSYLHYAYPQLSATDFLDFTITGNRVRAGCACAGGVCSKYRRIPAGYHQRDLLHLRGKRLAAAAS